MNHSLTVKEKRSCSGTFSSNLHQLLDFLTINPPAFDAIQVYVHQQLR